MRVLIIEDIDFRQNFIKEKIGNKDADWAPNAEKALAFLEENNYDLVFLDHDLIGAKSGSYITELWYQQKEKFKTQKPVVIIHSMNMIGAQIMTNYLKGVARTIERIPFRLIVTEKVDLQQKVKELMSI